MEHEDKMLNFSPLLGRIAMDVHAYAKALHFKEIEFKSNELVVILEYPFESFSIHFFTNLFLFSSTGRSRGLDDGE
jgi:hypothetical protein